jgi:hypothetical protein
MENKKLKNLLKKLFENKEFEMTITDEEYSWDEDERDYTTEEVTHDFKFHVVVRTVVGEGSGAVGDMDIIIDSITKDGDDYYHDWVDRNYSSSTWYIEELKEKFYLDFLEDLPFGVYMTVYGYDEKGKDDTIQESVIKRVIKEILKER